MLAAREASDAS